MQTVRAAALAVLLWISVPLVGGSTIKLLLNDASQVQPRNVTIEAVHYGGGNALEVRLTGPYRGPDTDTFAFVPSLDFHNGTIQVDVAGPLLANAPSDTRGFIGVAFHVDDKGGSYSCEGLYVRPTTARAEDQVRRSHSIQYFSYPGYDFDRLRREAPGRHEFYTDLVPGEWTHLRIEVSGAIARFYLFARSKLGDGHVSAATEQALAGE